MQKLPGHWRVRSIQVQLHELWKCANKTKKLCFMAHSFPFSGVSDDYTFGYQSKAVPH